jgi:low temperature requirement protein LtrA
VTGPPEPHAPAAPVPRTLWAKPRLRADEEAGRERKTSWLELFYDLVFVVIVAALSHLLATHPDRGGLASFVLLFLPACWLWIGGTFYTERFEVEDLSHRLFTFLQMFPVAAMAVFAHAGTGETSVPFALSYVAGRLLIIFLWFRAGLHDRRAKPVTDRFTAGFLLSVALFLASLWVAPPLRFALWLLALAIDFCTPLFTLRLQARLPRYSTSRLPERFGLFVLIVLGENVVSVISGVAAHAHPGLRTLATGALGMLLAFGFWWIYFDLVHRRQPRPGLAPGLLRNYLHVPLIMAMTATAAATLTILAADATAVPSGLRWLLAGSVAATLACLALLHAVLRPGGAARVEAGLRRMLWAGVAGCVLLGAAGAGLTGLSLLAALVTVQVLLVLYAVLHWARGHLA